MFIDLDDTIAAIASAPGGGLRAIVRISGPQTAACLAGSVRLTNGAAIEAMTSAGCRTASMKLSPTLGEVPLRVHYWPTARSYTRQPSAELHLPGSPPVAQAALAAVCRAGTRLARPGEFTLRAFLAGRLDLTQAEAVLGVIEAADRRQLDAALAQLAGGLGRPLMVLREQLLNLLAHLEAGLDFADEQIEFITREELTTRLQAAVSAIQEVEQRMHSRGEANTLPRIVLAGLPNAGKSSLLNALTGEEAAIVSPVAGTTRDFVGRRLKLKDVECLLIDTAGVEAEPPMGNIAAAAQRIARAQTQQADLTLVCLDLSRPLLPAEVEQWMTPLATERLIIWTKADLPAANLAEEIWPGGIVTSSRTGAGLDDLRKAIAQRLRSRVADGDIVAATADRCRESLRLAAAALARAQLAANQPAGEELTAAEIRLALDELGRVVGAIYTEDVLDRIFSRFCIGK